MDRRYSAPMGHRCVVVALIFFSVALVHAAPVAPPPAGKLYHGRYFGGVGTASHDPTEHDFSPQDIEQYEKTVGANTARDYFSDHWFESRKFPAGIGPATYVTAYRHIVDLMRNEGADNVQWVWHVNWFDEPEQKWTACENYFPGEDYCDWVALSVYGPTTPRTRDDTESFAFKLRE